MDWPEADGDLACSAPDWTLMERVNGQWIPFHRTWKRKLRRYLDELLTKVTYRVLRD